MMDADQLTEQALVFLESEDFEQAKICLKEAAALAPLRTDIRDLLVKTMQLEEAYLAEVGHSKRKENRARWGKLSSGRLALGAIGIVVCLAIALTAFYLLKDYFSTPPDVNVREILENDSKPTPTPGGAQPPPTSPSPTPTPTPDPRTLEIERAQKEFESALAASKRSEAKAALESLKKWNAPDVEKMSKRLAQAYFLRGEDRYNRGAVASGASQKTYLDAAEKELLEAVALDPDLLKAYATLAKTYNKLRNRELTGVYYRKIIQLAPASAEAKDAEKALKDLRLPLESPKE